MPHLSKRKIDPNIEEQIKNSFTILVKNLDNAPDTEKFLSSILSETERIMIAKRITAAFLLRHNIASTIVGDILKLTPETIARQRLWIQTHQEGFDILFNKMERQKRKESVKNTFYKILDYAIRAGSGQIPNPFRKKFKKGDLKLV